MQENFSNGMLIVDIGFSRVLMPNSDSGTNVVNVRDPRIENKVNESYSVSN
jgi:hypothetical protein